jgi:aminoglycoside phosphotransferase (APT) family kinase protein
VKLHDGEVDISGMLVRKLLEAQFPQWAGLPLAPVPAAGTDNIMFRLGEDLVVRLPRRPGSTIRKEHRWLPWLAPHLPLTIPSPVALGRPGEGYPLEWAISRWLPGSHDIADLPGAAAALGDFVAAMQRIEVPPDAPPAYRGGSYKGADESVRAALRDFDLPEVSAVWGAALELPDPNRRRVWLHSDLLPPNLLADDGHLHAVIDFGCLGVGDPAGDLMPAWTVFDEDTRPIFRQRLNPDDETWERGRAWAIVFGLGAWHYYVRKNPPFAELGRRTVNQVLTEARSST